MNRHRPQRNHGARRTEPDERGASLVEYVLMVSLILLVALAGVSALGTGLADNVDNSASRVAAAGGLGN